MIPWTNEDLDKAAQQRYFLWLCSLVDVGRTKRDRERRELLWFLNNIEFTWFVPNDHNRAEDGKKLRETFISDTLNWNGPVFAEPCTMLEMLIALAQRIDFILATSGKTDLTYRWFWEMITNLDLQTFSDDDPFSVDKVRANDTILNILMKREYSGSGKGGLFPLKKYGTDQRTVEIWYQMHTYLNENYAI